MIGYSCSQVRKCWISPRGDLTAYERGPIQGCNLWSLLNLRGYQAKNFTLIFMTATYFLWNIRSWFCAISCVQCRWLTAQIDLSILIFKTLCQWIIEVVMLMNISISQRIVARLFAIVKCCDHCLSFGSMDYYYMLARWMKNVYTFEFLNYLVPLVLNTLLSILWHIVVSVCGKTSFISRTGKWSLWW